MRNRGKLKILGQVWQVKSKPEIVIDGEHQSGYVDWPNNIIWISADQSADELKSTVLHEALHIADGLFQMKLSEKLVSELERFLFSLIRENKKSKLLP